ncbi:MAG: hypothetical protein FWH17_02075 [Oscillospiraceae bacterium]|nr:hypothetical protein [Oscillospiraceae bacterium]
MTNIMRNSGKRVFAILIATILIVGIIPGSVLPGVFAATQPIFTVEIPNTVGGSISVTLKNSMNATETQTEPMFDGVATFTDFVDLDNTYDIAITGMTKYDDFYDTGLFLGGAGISFTAADFDLKTFSITTNYDEPSLKGTITASEMSIPYGSIKSVTAEALNGYLIAEFFVDGEPVLEAVNREEYTCEFELVADNHIVYVAFIAKTWEINFTIYGSGTIDDGTNVITDGGKITASEGDSPGFTATANKNYHISSVVISPTPDTPITGAFDSTRTEYTHIFTGISKDYSVTVTFSINTYDIAISSTGNGSITVGGSPAGGSQKVGHGSNLSLSITPDAGHMIGSIWINGSEIDDDDPNLTIYEDYTYTFINVTAAGSSISVSFVPIGITDENEEDLFTFNHSHKVDYYETATQRFYVFKNNASVTFNPVDSIKYRSIQIDGSGFEPSQTLTTSRTITTVSISTSRNGRRGTETKTLAKDIVIVIDKAVPTAADIPAMEWTNQDYTVSGIVTDQDTVAFPSSGFSRVVWSKSTLTPAQVLAETTNTALITDTAKSGDTISGKYAFTITEEQNNETFYVYAVDKADNVSAAKTVNIKIDKTPPEITGFHFQQKPATLSQVINFLTFGTFSNNEIEVVVTANDSGISSGLDKITLYSDEVAIGAPKAVSGSSATFTLTLADFNANEISASIKDIAGNSSAGKTKPTDPGVTSNAFSDIVSLKNEEPTISIVPASSALHTNGTEEWYDGDVGFTITVDTESGGIFSVIIKVNGQVVTTDKNGKAIDENFYESLTLQEIFTVNTTQNPVDGENIIEVVAVNNFGNEETVGRTVYIDTTNPDIAGFSITKENGSALSKTLNFLTFGIFFNERVKVTIIADDRGGASAGMNTITLYADGDPIAGSPKAVTAVGDGTFQAEFVLPASAITVASKHIDVLLSAVATDNVGNVTGRDAAHPDGKSGAPNTINSDILNSRLMIETVPPTIDIDFPDAVYTEKGKKWYPNDILFTITARDVDSGIRSVEININGESITADRNGKAINADFYLSETNEAVFHINTNQGEINADGSYAIEVTVVDNADNAYSISDIVYKDIDDPYITRFEFVPATSNGISETSEFIEFFEYGFYFKEEFIANIHVSDLEPSSGLNNVAYRFVSYQNGKRQGEISGTQEIVAGVASLTVPKGFKGQIFVEAFDNVGNQSGDKTTQAFAIDAIAPEIEITNNTATDYKDADGNKLYRTDMSFTVTVYDDISGIKEIGYSQSAEQESFERKVISVNNTGYQTGDELEDGWIIAEMDFNLVTKVIKTFSFSADDNDVFLTFDAVDRSENRIENVQSEKITIDTTPPVINVVFRADEAKNEYYYSATRSADITVLERNFDASLINTIIENTFGQVPSFSFTQISNIEYVAVIDFEEGDYTFDMSGTDLGNHTVIVNFSGGNENLFYVDKTPPVIEENFITFSNAITDNSFNKDMTATIKITEHNFDPELTNLIITRKGAGEAHNGVDMVDVTDMMGGNRWESQGDVHTISFAFDVDAVYQIEITPRDLAGNSADQRSTVVFEIDKTVPIVSAKNEKYVSADDVEFLDMYPYSRKDEPAPTVEFMDLNIDHIRYDLTVYIPDYTNGKNEPVVKPVKVYLNEDKNQSGVIKGNLFTLPDFTKDGIYAVKLVAVDTAGNESVLNFNTYVRLIEDDVLAYISNSSLEAKTGWYSIQYENGDTISKKPDNFSDIDIVVFANKDTGRDIVLRDNNGAELNTNLKAIEDDNMFGIGIYSYTLNADYFKENFQDDTDVELHLSVKNDQVRIDLGKLHIDNIAPICNIPGDFKSWSWYYGNEDRTITISNISELIDESQCKVYNNGREIDFVYSSENNTLTFTLSKGWHSVGIVLADVAGNVNNIQERENIHIGLFWLYIIIAASVIVAPAAVAIVIHRVKKKRMLENA